MLYLSPALTAYLLIVSALLGAVMGSFLNCMAWRIVHGESVTRGRSHCAVCGHVLSAPDLVPVFSWLFLRGRCRYCGEKISVRYTLAELVCAAVYVSLLLRFDISWEFLQFCWLLSLLFAASLVDLEALWLPDRFLLCAAVGFFPLGYLSGGTAVLLRGLLGAAALFLPLLALVLLFDKVLGRESMGGGDLKLVAVLGLYFGWRLGLFLILVACVAGLLLGAALGAVRTKREFPFGPALAVAAWVTALGGEAAVGWYLGLFA